MLTFLANNNNIPDRLDNEFVNDDEMVQGE